jgi:N-succinyldiaminopimelate aminotransferase
MDIARLAQLAESPFTRLNALLEGIEPAPGVKPLLMQIGEPRLPTPPLAARVIAERNDLWSNYPSIRGTDDFRAATTAWLNRRYGLPSGYIDADRNVLPVSGTREALYMAAQLATPDPEQWPNGRRPVALMPNPMYHVYYAAAVMAGAEPVPVAATSETGFLPNFSELGDDILGRAAIAYVCTPGNPQGAVASLEYLEKLAVLARRHNFLLAVDECYSEIYRAEPPAGALEACAALGEPPENVLVFHSLSKRSSAPGLRSGFVAGDPDVIASFALLRNLGGPQVPGPIQAASAALWRDETHVTANRQHYATLFDLAERILGNHTNFYKPPGGFYLWLDVGDGEEVAQRLWREAAVKILPGAFMAWPDGKSGVNPGHPYIRVAMVDDAATTEDALKRIARVIGEAHGSD